MKNTIILNVTIKWNPYCSLVMFKMLLRYEILVVHLKPTSWTITIISKLFWYDPENNLVATPKLFWIHCVNIRQKLWIWQVVFISVVYETKWWWAKLIEGFCDPAKKLEIQGPNSLGYILCKNYLECMPTSTWYFTLLFYQIKP